MQIDNWEEMCRKYERNRNAMHIKICIQLVNQKMDIRIAQIDQGYEKYEGTMLKLVDIISRGAWQFMLHILDPTGYASPEHLEVEKEKVRCQLANSFDTYLNVLFNDSWERFVDQVSTQASINEVAYRLCTELQQWQLGIRKWGCIYFKRLENDGWNDIL